MLETGAISKKALAATGSTLVTNGVFNADGSWSTSGFNKSGPTASVTAFGYCLKA